MATETTSEPTSEATETWYCPSSSGTPAEPKIGPGDSPNDPRADWPWDVLRFVRGFLTINTADKHYPEWRRWLTMSKGALPGLRVVSQAERDAIEYVPSDNEWADLEARHAAAVARRR